VLIDYGSEIDPECAKGDTPLVLAVIAGEEAVVKLLVEAGEHSKN
jgi:ankyrin repeat protein